MWEKYVFADTGTLTIFFTLFGKIFTRNFRSVYVPVRSARAIEVTYNTLGTVVKALGNFPCWSGRALTMSAARVINFVKNTTLFVPDRQQEGGILIITGISLITFVVQVIPAQVNKPFIWARGQGCASCKKGSFF